MRIQDYPYNVITQEEPDWKEQLEDLEPGSVVIDSESDVLTLKYDAVFHKNRWFVAGQSITFRYPSLPCIVLVAEFGPDDYPEDWEEMGGEAL